MDFSSPFLTQHLITYLGNKRKLLRFINSAIDDIKQDIGNPHPAIFDGFAGSGATARLFKHYSSSLYVNDLEDYCDTLNRCYMANRSDAPVEIAEAIDTLNARKLDALDPGFIELNYAPRNDDNIQEGERVFYTNQNAKIIDNIRRNIDEFPNDLRPFLLAPLLVQASIHANTSGVFKGFHKKGKIGHFGGKGEHALSRIKGEIILQHPVWCEHECPTFIMKEDVNTAIEKIPPVDIVYYDPPYNQHPYGSNYFMLNIINNYDNAPIQDGVSGISTDWNKSLYNMRRKAEVALAELLEKTHKKTKYILISYNDEGIIPYSRFAEIIAQFGDIDIRTEDYNAYRGSKNFGKNKTLKDGGTRAIKVQELLWIVKVR